MVSPTEGLAPTNTSLAHQHAPRVKSKPVIGRVEGSPMRSQFLDCARQQTLFGLHSWGTIDCPSMVILTDDIALKEQGNSFFKERNYREAENLLLPCH